MRKVYDWWFKSAARNPPAATSWEQIHYYWTNIGMYVQFPPNRIRAILLTLAI
jgi:hypothetical protein